MDYQQPGCSYAPMVGIWDNRTDSNNAGWFSGLRGSVPSLDTPLECQLICQNVTGCDFWSFEIETDIPEARCFLKGAYSDPNCGYSTRWSDVLERSSPRPPPVERRASA
jgi:hypothetical protein